MLAEIKKILNSFLSLFKREQNKKPNRQQSVKQLEEKIKNNSSKTPNQIILDKKEIGSRLKSFLLSKYRTINEAAEILGTTGASLSNSYFNGKSIPGRKVLEKLNEMGCDFHWLLTGETVTRSNTYNIESRNVTNKVIANNQEIADRLKEFLKIKFGSIDKGAEAIGTTGNTLRSSYLNGRSLPCTNMLIELYNIGCDIHWLLTGQYSSYFSRKIIEENKALKTQISSYKNKLNEIKKLTLNGLPSYSIQSKDEGIR